MHRVGAQEFSWRLYGAAQCTHAHQLTPRAHLQVLGECRVCILTCIRWVDCSVRAARRIRAGSGLK